MSRPRKTEVRLIGDLIEKAFDQAGGELDIDALAGDLIVAIDEARSRRDWYAAVARIPMGSGVPIYLASGPFTTTLQAHKDLARLTVPGPGEGKGRVVKLRPSLVEE